MYWTSILITAIVAGLPSWVTGQESGWVDNQVSATMCAWKALRAAQLNDTVYMDGGYLYWVPGFADGSLGSPTQDGNPLGLIYTLNFSIPFNSSTNVSSILGRISKAPNGGAANNFAPNYYDGAMLANNHEFFLYGGLLRNTMQYTLPDGDEVLAYQVSDYGVVKEGFRPGFLNDKLSDGVTRYVTYGGAANAPSENKAWYFGGYSSPSRGPIYQPSANNSLNPVNVSDTLITLDLSTQQSEKWSNSTLPSGIPSRANPSVVWVPVGEQGILVVLGGVSYPEYSTVNKTSANVAQSEKDSPTYMANIDIYDIASGTWYQQPTTGAPSQLAMGCAVVATAQDYSSYNIYYYGGFDGLHEDEDFNDSVWILSLPSFMWMKISSGTSGHARAGHQCVTPYPDQMVTIGGFRPAKGAGLTCLDGGILQVFNLTTGTWLDSYDPNNWNMYGVPEMINMKIGGDYTGGATITTPTPSGWATQGLASVFATKYPASKITPNYPYSSQGAANGTRGTFNDNSKGGGTPSWVAPVLGVVLGLVFVTAIVVGILLYRRRKLLSKKNNTSNAPTEDYLHRIGKWLNSTNDKAQTVTTEHPSSRYDYMESRNDTPMLPGGYVSPSPEMTHHEMPVDQPCLELMDTSKPIPRPIEKPVEPVELSGDALPYNDIITKHTRLHTAHSPHSGSPHSVLKPPSFYTSSVSQDQPSSLSSSQAGIPPPSVAATLGFERPDSPSLGNPGPPRRTPPPNRDAVVSDLSRISERHMSHLRSLSHDTVSSTSAPSLSSTPPAIHAGFDNGPVSPPLPSPPSAVDDHDAAGDYVSARQALGGAGLSRVPGTSSSERRSVFRESKEDLGDLAGRNTR
ncbi:hypothetical protein F5Y12DRAFT_799738 [Xylaria sp. FL1777]|nr:hypothetical protein F5Y12DRAFT_799738 [Xylaria sp. FL1777]